MPLKINFILPFKPRRPAGGFRVMYEYANRLARRGYRVHLIYPLKTKHMSYRLPYWGRRLLACLEGFRTNKWFDFDASITMRYVPQIENCYIPDADLVIATWWTTASEMGKLSETKGRKMNLIQGYETWTGREEEVHTSYNIPGITNIVVASYLKEIVENHSDNESILIHNAVDKNVFNIQIPIEERNPYKLAMTYSEQELKGSKYGLEAASLVKEHCPELELDLFGVSPEPKDLPGWVHYHRNPTNLPEIYNRTAIFLSNSFTEGFPLTPAEALFCGCALICTDIDGHREYAVDYETAILVPVGDSETMGNKILQLISDEDLRISLAKTAHREMMRFDWEIAVDKMERVMRELVNK